MVKSGTTYSWTWSGTSSSTAATTTATFDVASIGANGTYTIALTASGKATDGTTDVTDKGSVSV